MIKGILNAAAAALVALLGATGTAAAQQIGLPEPRQLDLQPPVTPIAQQVHDLHHLMLYIIAGICVFVLGLLLIVILRYNSAVNKTPSTFTHNSLVEVIWTVAPVIILIVIAVPSVKLLQAQEDFSKVEPDIVIKATGNQWNWSYEYPELGIEEYISNMVGKGVPVRTAAVEAELAEFGYPPETWKFATDTAMVVPVGATVVVRVTASDVIHSWTVPAFAVKADGVPGRTNNTWFRADVEGIYFGQCSELCGTDHSFMPITVKVVSQAEFDAWAACSQATSAYDCPTPRMDEMLAEAERKRAGAVDTAQLEDAAATEQ